MSILKEYKTRGVIIEYNDENAKYTKATSLAGNSQFCKWDCEKVYRIVSNQIFCDN